MMDEFLNNGIVAGIQPKIGTADRSISGSSGITEIQDVPGTENLGFSEMVAVIVRLNDCSITLKTKIGQNSVDLI